MIRRATWRRQTDKTDSPERSQVISRAEGTVTGWMGLACQELNYCPASLRGLEKSSTCLFLVGERSTGCHLI